MMSEISLNTIDGPSIVLTPGSTPEIGLTSPKLPTVTLVSVSAPNIVLTPDSTSDISLNNSNSNGSAPAAVQQQWDIVNMVDPYFGFTDANAAWLIRKLDSISGAVTYAGIYNNPTITTYASAWSARATLTYGLVSEAL